MMLWGLAITLTCERECWEPNEWLTLLAGRLRDHADNVQNPASRKTLGADLQRAADAASDLVSTRFAVAELAKRCTDEKTATELKKLISDGA